MGQSKARRSHSQSPSSATPGHDPEAQLPLPLPASLLSDQDDPPPSHPIPTYHSSPHVMFLRSLSSSPLPLPRALPPLRLPFRPLLRHTPISDAPIQPLLPLVPCTLPPVSPLTRPHHAPSRDRNEHNIPSPAPDFPSPLAPSHLPVPRYTARSSVYRPPAHAQHANPPRSLLQSRRPAYVTSFSQLSHVRALSSTAFAVQSSPLNPFIVKQTHVLLLFRKTPGPCFGAERGRPFSVCFGRSSYVCPLP
ncbi:hypothetical protein C8Q79DRAFT_364631 [Trametes meyenii]|nr:hypothetical protein C8Q79DRAFT_364631 [Trametes meyenii]